MAGTGASAPGLPWNGTGDRHPPMTTMSTITVAARRLHTKAGPYRPAHGS
jgi:hypothetical protein